MNETETREMKAGQVWLGPTRPGGEPCRWVVVAVGKHKAEVVEQTPKWTCRAVVDIAKVLADPEWVAAVPSSGGGTK